MLHRPRRSRLRKSAGGSFVEEDLEDRDPGIGLLHGQVARDRAGLKSADIRIPCPRLWVRLPERDFGGVIEQLCIGEYVTSVPDGQVLERRRQETYVHTTVALCPHGSRGGW